MQFRVCSLDRVPPILIHKLPTVLSVFVSKLLKLCKIPLYIVLAEIKQITRHSPCEERDNNSNIVFVSSKITGVHSRFHHVDFILGAALAPTRLRTERAARDWIEFSHRHRGTSTAYRIPESR